MTDGEIERMTLCIAQMAATLEAGDRAACAHQAASGFFGTMEAAPAPAYYAERARELYNTVEHVVAHGKPMTFEAGGL
jgi:hypothetical protein